MTTDALPTQHSEEHETECANCGMQLAGEYCHGCGQHAHNPLKSFKHAVEDVFESFWHVDGRIFQTLRDICVPGRAALNYLNGKRIRYLPPLRIFLILSVFTFFLAHLAMPEKNGLVLRENGYEDATTVEEVQKDRAKDLAEAQQTPHPGQEAVIAAINASAEARIAALEGRPVPEATSKGTGLAASMKRQADAARANPYKSKYMPGWFDRLVQTMKLRAFENVAWYANSGESIATPWLSGVPTALFFMVPVFALLLRIFYWRSPFSYLEQLVVALYSHAHLLMLSATLLLFALLATWTGIAALKSLAQFLVWPAVIWAAVYLFLSQKRIYGQSNLKTTVKYLMLGFLHFNLLVFMATLALLFVFFK